MNWPFDHLDQLLEDPQAFIDDEIKRRTERAKKIATKFPELKGLEYREFLERVREFGIELDFITAVETHKALNE